MENLTEHMKYPWLCRCLIAIACAAAVYVETGPWTAFIIFSVIMFAYGNRSGINFLCKSSDRALEREKRAAERTISFNEDLLAALNAGNDELEALIAKRKGAG